MAAGRRIGIRLLSSTVLKRRQLECIAALADGRPAHECFSEMHGRRLQENAASAEECRRAVAYAQRAMRICSDSDGEGRLFPPHVPEAAALLGDDGLALFALLQERVVTSVRELHGDQYEHANSLISWISGSGASKAEELPLRSFDYRLDPASGTYAPHVDMANQPEYRISALLYLSSAGSDFTGGHFCFNDADSDRLVRPLAGRLLSFPSGFENLHQVRPVLSGDRLVLSVWFRATESNEVL